MNQERRHINKCCPYLAMTWSLQKDILIAGVWLVESLGSRHVFVCVVDARHFANVEGIIANVMHIEQM